MPCRVVVDRRNAIGSDARPILIAFDDGRGALVATFDDFEATASARRANGVAAATKAPRLVAAGPGPVPIGPAAIRSSSSAALRTSNGSAKTRSSAASTNVRTRWFSWSAM